jgi:hypothetical protein
MAEPPPSRNIRLYPKGPSFGLVVVLAAIALIVIFAIAYFVIGGSGKSILPKERRRVNPTAYLVRPTPGPVAPKRIES